MSAIKTDRAAHCNQKREQNTWGECLRLVRGEKNAPEWLRITRCVFIKEKIFRKNK